MSNPYTTAIGDAGQAYLKSLVMSEDGKRQLLGDPNQSLPATFRWHELYETMMRAAGDPALDVIQVFESWGEREANLTAVLLDLAIAATLKKVAIDAEQVLPATQDMGSSNIATLTITTADLREMAERWDIQRTESAGAWTISIRPLEMTSERG